MEPSNLNPSTEDDRLAALLRRRTDPIPDDGFSARVLAALPSARRDRPAIPLAAVMLGALAGILYAWWHGASAADVVYFVRLLGAITLQLAATLGDPRIWFAVLLTVASLYAARRLAGAGRFG